MLFKFLKYVKPTSYFTLKNNDNRYIYPDISELPKSILNCLVQDHNYKSYEAQKLDLSYQAVEKGYIGQAKKLEKVPNIPLEDEYLFLKKYFSSFWYFHTFLLRILLLNNIIVETKAFIKAWKGKSNLYEKPIKYSAFDNFQSKLIENQSKISVIIPTLNRYSLLYNVLKDLEKQDYKFFDVYIIDQSEPFRKSFYDDFRLDLKIIHQKEKALWLARNRAIETTDSKFLLFFDDDSSVNNNWISSHLKCLEFFDADISSGTSISQVGDKVPVNYSFFKFSEQLDTGNALIKRNVFKKIGLYDRQFEKQRMGDGEFGLRAFKAGFKNISNPKAQRLHLKAEIGGLRHHNLWDGFRVNKWLDPRPIPSVLYYHRRYFGKKMTIYNLMRTIPSSILPYKFKGSKAASILSYLLIIPFAPFMCIQIFKSWKLSNQKINNGPIIKELKT